MAEPIAERRKTVSGKLKKYGETDANDKGKRRCTNRKERGKNGTIRMRRSARFE